MLDIFDFIVVGSGPGGSVTADLTSKAGFSTLVLEEAEPSKANYLSHSLDEISESYRHSGLSVSLGKKPIALIEGKALGGSSQINSGIYHRTPQAVYDLWLKKLPTLLTSDLENIFDRIEEALNINSNYQSDFTDLLINGSESLGWDYSMRPRWVDSSRKDIGIVQRFTMQNTYLKEAISNSAKIILGKKVLSIKMKNNIWRVETVNRIKETEIFYCKKLVLSAGAIQTPIILRNSGFKKNIGKTFRLHPMVRFIYRFNGLEESPDTEVPPFQITKWLPGSTLGCSASKPSDVATWINSPAFNYYINDKIHKYRICYSLISTTTIGRLIKLSKYQYRLFFNISNIDFQKLLISTINLNTLMKASGAEMRLTNLNHNNLPIIHTVDTNWNNKNIVKRELESSNLSTIHIYGSCPMGMSDSNSACNQFGQVWNTKNLYVNDSSILPDNLGVNPQGTIMALSIRNAEKMIKEFN
jgi:choline dehydrogenase-like flavoprotein